MKTNLIRFPVFAVSILLLGLLISKAAYTSANFDMNYFTLTPPTVEEIPDTGTPSPFLVGTTGLPSVSPMAVFGDIVSAGKLILELVQDNKATGRVDTDIISALPQGAPWHALQGWSAPITKTFRVTYRNMYKKDMVVFDYKILYTHGGTFNGKGQYLSGVTSIASHLSVGWGYKFNARAVVPGIVNVGTSDNPIAGIQMIVNHRTESVFKHEEGSRVYMIRGDGLFLDQTSH